MVTETDSGIGTDLDTVEDTAEKLECAVLISDGLTGSPLPSHFLLRQQCAMCIICADMAWRLCPECGTGPDD